MLKRIVQQVSGQVMALYIQASMWLKEQLLPSVKQLLASITQAFLNVASLFSQLVQTVLNIKVWLASRTTAAQLTNQEHINAKHLATQLGLQPQTIAVPTPQPVLPAQLQKLGKPAASTKLAKSSSKKTCSAQTRTGRQSMVDGEKSVEIAKPRRQRATKQSKKGN